MYERYILAIKVNVSIDGGWTSNWTFRSMGAVPKASWIMDRAATTASTCSQARCSGLSRLAYCHEPYVRTRCAQRQPTDSSGAPRIAHIRSILHNLRSFTLCDGGSLVQCARRRVVSRPIVAHAWPKNWYRELVRMHACSTMVHNNARIWGPARTRAYTGFDRLPRYYATVECFRL